MLHSQRVSIQYQRLLWDACKDQKAGFYGPYLQEAVVENQEDHERMETNPSSALQHKPAEESNIPLPHVVLKISIPCKNMKTLTLKV